MSGMSDLYDETMTLLQQAPKTRREIAKGAGVGLEWLTKFAQGRIPDPGIRRVEKLRAYLSQEKNAAA